MGILGIASVNELEKRKLINPKAKIISFIKNLEFLHVKCSGQLKVVD